MAFYYVKSGFGTATGDGGRYATQQTGTFAALGAAGVYGSIIEAIAATTSPIASDLINPSDLHDHSISSSILYTGIPENTFYVVSVQDANIDLASSTRAKETASGASNDISAIDMFMSGIELVIGDIFTPQNSKFYGCKINLTGAGNNINISNDGAIAEFIGCELAIDQTNTDIIINNGATFNFIGGSVTTISAGLVSLLNTGGLNGGMKATFTGADLSAVTGTLVADMGGGESADDEISITFDMCKLASGVAFTNEVFKSKNQRALFTRCSDSSAAAEYQYHLHAFGGDVDDDSAIFRNEDEPFTESNQKISYKIVTNSDASLGSPLWLDFPVLRYSKLSTGATDTLRFYITSNTALTDKDIYIEISYPDGTNKQTPNFLSSAPTTVGGTLDLMATGTALTTDGSSSWTGALSNLYQIDVDTSGNAGADCQPIVKVYVTLPSTTIQIASEFGLN